jgi:hypothetical protein
VMRRVRIARENGDHFLAILDAAGVDLMAEHHFRSGGPTNATFSLGLTSFIISAIFTSTLNPGVEVNRTRSSKSEAIATVWSIEILCGGASTTLLSGIMPAE